MTRTLLVSWSISRGRDTYGYNICRLDDTATGKRYRCNGGGYDMTGTVFAEWLEDVAQDQLRAISDRAHQRLSRTGEDGPWDRAENGAGLYGMSYYTHDDTVHLDGACGLSSIERVAKEIGLQVGHITNRRGHLLGFTVEGIGE